MLKKARTRGDTFFFKAYKPLSIDFKTWLCLHLDHLLKLFSGILNTEEVIAKLAWPLKCKTEACFHAYNTCLSL